MEEQHPFIDSKTARALAERFGTPLYVYDEKTLRANAEQCLAFPHAFGLKVRFAMKACPTAAILKLFNAMGLHFDASSVYEVYRAMRAGIPAEKISLSTQELPVDFEKVIRQGILFNACSLDQLERFGKAFTGAEVGVRFNPGEGSGGSGKTNVGGPDSSFGIWHEHAGAVHALLQKYGLKLVRIHTHIGSGSDPAVWQKVALQSLRLVEQFGTVHTLDFGGGYKVARVPEEHATDLQLCGAPVRDAIRQLAKETGRELDFEIEPGTFLLANAGAILTRVQDIVDTGAGGRQFIKLDTGMNEILRPSLYGAQHPIFLISSAARSNIPPRGEIDYVVVGHCCESGDLLSCAPGKPETLATRRFVEAGIGDLCVIGGAGAYCSSMAAKNYNSFPEAAEVMICADGSFKQIRLRQTLEQMVQNEIG
ncbi:MAG: diaminopimelate decarboxylase [Opitutales bacterium]|nr:diaminopimelate decarboxylase [Opitutales bacterium]